MGTQAGSAAGEGIDGNASCQHVVVTGGAGFIGSHTVGLLLDLGHRVTVLDNYCTGKKENLQTWWDHPNLRISESNIVDGIWPGLQTAVAEYGPVDRIVHLAAQTAVVSSIANPLDDVRMNYATTVHVLEYARYNKIKKVVFASSAAVYGDLGSLPIREDLPCTPVSPYGIDKLGSEYFLRYYTTVHGIASQCLRFFNVFGPRQDPRSAYSGVISVFFDRAIRGEVLRIYGNGEQTRDFVYVGDVAGAITKTVLRDDGAGEPLNIGTGSEVSVNRLAALVIEAAGSKSSIEHADARSGEILRSQADISQARKAFGFEPKVALAAGLTQTADWIREEYADKS